MTLAWMLSTLLVVVLVALGFAGIPALAHYLPMPVQHVVSHLIVGLGAMMVLAAISFPRGVRASLPGRPRLRRRWVPAQFLALVLGLAFVIAGLCYYRNANPVFLVAALWFPVLLFPFAFLFKRRGR
jgi:hypothetical protein